MLLNKITNFVLFFLVLVVSGCATQMAMNTSGQIYKIDSKLLIEDKTKNDSNTLFSEIYFVDQGPIRMEVNAAFGISVGSMVMTPKNIQILVPSKETLIVGPFSSRTLKTLLKADVDPIIFWNLILDKPMSSSQFSCVQNEKNLQTCTGKDIKQGHVTVKVEILPQNQIKPLKKMTIETDSIKIVWLYKSISPYNETNYSQTFVLKKPEDFKLLTIK